MPLTYCGNLVRQQDPDRFLLSLLAPADRRPSLWALYAFNYEVAKTREVVSETATGLIRLTWWREAIDEIYKGAPVRQHAVVQATAQAIREYDLPQSHFDTLVFAREFDVEDRNPATLEGLFHYADYTTTPLTDLSLRIMGEVIDEAETRAASIRYAVTGLIRSVPYMLKNRRCYLPEDIMNAQGFSAQKLFDFNQKDKLPDVVKEIVEGLPPLEKSPVKYVRAMNALSDMYLSQIRRAGFDVFHPALQAPPAFKALRLWWAS